MNTDVLRERYARVLERLDAACAAAGRGRDDVVLIAVSKLHPAADVAAVARAGQLDFGENYVQEALQKREELAGEPACRNVRWHMIGHVQSRKAAQVAGAFALIHTLDSRKLADGLERRLAVLEARQPVLMEVNVAAEPQKSGIMAEDLPALADYIVESCPHLELRGLMCLPPVFDAGEAARPHFARLRVLCEELRARLGLPLPELSMGMSGDFEAAVAEGATLVRIGTDIFGPRPPRT
ncbi:MAG: YggS family pyridoxal phosphate-dependent enzyme [Desulfovibrio sp.]|mgnify:FL=1|uniref:YggS family pyridoxal phosphate-dependent enzyme n=1 Tax=Desulfovibrio sp. TaxID=885 RepID=UPI0025BBFEB7|nr:YggS family pyridoxal phosphate-dependent enzyme [Desulfovibrio sp.]MBS6828877.1 YggS family pyridoxal phosphate-dependent enzyme [Desulfovibrio sp.]